MTTKRPRSIRSPKADLSRPTTWRRQHDNFVLADLGTDSDTGHATTRHRAVDTLGQMLNNGTVTIAMHDAGTQFRHLFRMAQLGSIGASSLVRTAGVTPPGPTDHHITAGLREIGRAHV